MARVTGQRLGSMFNLSTLPRSANFCISVPQLAGPPKVSIAFLHSAGYRFLCQDFEQCLSNTNTVLLQHRRTQKSNERGRHLTRPYDPQANLEVYEREQGNRVQGKPQFTSKEGNRSRNRQKDKEKPRRNPFHSNVGASRQLRSLGLDVDDPELNKQDFLLQEQSLESHMEESKAFRKQWKADEAELKELAKRKIVQKKMFPKPPNPNLLTWLEKETIRFLHKQDPVEWNHERLAESFPATPGVIHKVLRGATLTSPERIAEYNAEVTSNWKLLAKGKLELDSNYQQHLASSSGAELPLTQRLLAEQDAVG